MGGTAFVEQGYESKRMDVARFNEVKSAIYEILDSLKIEYYDVPYIREKETFGDIDIVVLDNKDEKAVDIIMNNADKFGDVKFNRNKDLLSMLYEEHQIDFITSYAEFSNYHVHYLSHNDLGNLLGRTIKQANYKHGHDGLFYTYREGNTFKVQIPLTTNIDVTLDILGLDRDQFHNGFDTFEDMFKYVTSSPYFKASRYELSALNNRNKVRDRKRKSYNGFLKYIKGMKDSSLDIPSPFETFPDLQSKVDAIKSQRAAEKMFKSKFNGGVVMQYVDISGKELGELISIIKSKYTEEIYTFSDSEIKDLIITEFNAYKLK